MKQAGAAKARRPSQQRTHDRDTLNEIGDLFTRIGAAVRRHATLGTRLPSPLADLAPQVLQQVAAAVTDLERSVTEREAQARR